MTGDLKLSPPDTIVTAAEYLQARGVKLEPPGADTDLWTMDDGGVIGPQQIGTRNLVVLARRHYERTHKRPREKKCEWWQVPDLLPPRPVEPVPEGGRRCGQCGAPCKARHLLTNRLCRLCRNRYMNQWKRIRRTVTALKRREIPDDAPTTGASAPVVAQLFREHGASVHWNSKARRWQINGILIHPVRLAAYRGPMLEKLK